MCDELMLFLDRVCGRPLSYKSFLTTGFKRQSGQGVAVGSQATLRIARLTAGVARHPRSPQEGPARRAAPVKWLAERRAGGPCGPPRMTRGERPTTLVVERTIASSVVLRTMLAGWLPARATWIEERSRRLRSYVRSVVAMKIAAKMVSASPGSKRAKRH